MRLRTDDNGNPVQVLKPTSTEKLSISGTAASGAALSTTTTVLRLIATVDCYYSLDGTATTSSAYLPAGVIEYIGVENSDTLSVITGGSSGSLFITETV